MAAASASQSWHEANQIALSQALGRVRIALKNHVQRRDAAHGKDKSVAPAPDLPEPISYPASLPPSALDTLCHVFHLSPFERDLLLLCAGMELDADFAALCAAAQGDTQRAYPTFSLALAALPDPHWSAITPTSALRWQRLVEIGSGTGLTLSPLRIDERILHYLTGVSHMDERLLGLLDPFTKTGALVPSHQAQAEQIAITWSQAIAAGGQFPAIQLCGGETAAKRAVSAQACALLGLNLWVAAAEALPTNPGELETFLRLWEREASLTKSALLLECDDLDPNDTARANAASRVVERVTGVLLIGTHDRRRMRQRALVTVEIEKPAIAEQRILWRETLGPDTTAHLNGHIELLAAQFDMSDHTIRAASAEAQGRAAQQASVKGSLAPDISHLLWDACRVNARPRLDDLAQRIVSTADWDDLVLPEAQRLILRDIAAHVRQRTRVYEEWGFAAKGARGLGISALFAGTSGTGKTLAAEVLARALNLDLYRIDLSAVVSKYIGESEKNLRRVFDAAEEGGAILLFDEADALFGKRSETKDSHDRYANIEVSYLLQRMECYRGLAVLTTNLKSALDTAFLRRLRFIVQFPFPDAVQRAEIWRRAFPPDTPTEGLDMHKLGRLNVAGGNIRNAALNAAFLAADAGEPVRMTHLLRAAQSEYGKLEKTLTEAEVAGWV